MKPSALRACSEAFISAWVPQPEIAHTIGIDKRDHVQETAPETKRTTTTTITTKEEEKTDKDKDCNDDILKSDI